MLPTFNHAHSILCACVPFIHSTKNTFITFPLSVEILSALLVPVLQVPSTTFLNVPVHIHLFLLRNLAALTAT